MTRLVSVAEPKHRRVDRDCHVRIGQDDVCLRVVVREIVTGQGYACGEVGAANRVALLSESARRLARFL